MRAATLVMILCWCSAAIADPAPATCEVTISRAPDDVRDAIEKWVRAEPRCTTSLDVRVVETDGGLYLFAQATTGRIYERVVPDAQSAGVLVASWIADDSVTWAPPVPGAYPAGAASAFAPPPVAADPRIEGSRAPGATLVASSALPHARSWRWIGVSGLVRVAEFGDRYGAFFERDTVAEGVRIDVDALRWRAWKLGAAVAATTTTRSEESTLVELTDVRALATLSHARQTGRWYLRLGGGMGAVRSSMQGYDAGGRDFQTEAWAPFAELGAAAGAVFLGDWAVEAGPLFTWRGQRLIMTSMELGYERRVTTNLFFGLRRRL